MLLAKNLKLGRFVRMSEALPIREVPNARRTKIVCTLGPSTSSQESIVDLIKAGMDCARLNFSHGDHDSHGLLAARVRKAAARCQKPVAILADLCGPKIRTGRFEDGEVNLEPGARFDLVIHEVQGNASQVSVSYERLAQDAQPGDEILLDDGLLRLRVERCESDRVVCQVEVGGVLKDRKGVNLPGIKLSVPALTDKDRDDLAFARDQLAVDYIALSFVRSPEDVQEAKELAQDIPVIAKLEKPEAIELLSEILDVADGAMVARGDLGVELGSEKVPLVQKRIIREVNARGKLVITATQMLDSMMRNPRPTRAEAADVANAILDGTDAIMLSGETASGKYPVQAVQMMNAIALEVEPEWMADQQDRPAALAAAAWGEWEFANAAARAAALMSRVLDLKAIVCFTEEGRTARLLSEYRPRAPIVAITADSKAARRLAIHWGVSTRVEVPPDDMEETLRIATSVLAREGWCARGQAFALVSGWPASERPNTVKLHRMG